MSVSGALGLVFILLVAWSLYRAHRDPALQHFNIFDLLMENGRVSRLAFVFMGSWAAMTWTFLKLAVEGRLTEGYFTAFAVSCYAPLVVRMFAPRGAGAPPASEAAS